MDLNEMTISGWIKPNTSLSTGTYDIMSKSNVFNFGLKNNGNTSNALYLQIFETPLDGLIDGTFHFITPWEWKQSNIETQFPNSDLRYHLYGSPTFSYETSAIPNGQSMDVIKVSKTTSSHWFMNKINFDSTWTFSCWFRLDEDSTHTDWVNKIVYVVNKNGSTQGLDIKFDNNGKLVPYTKGGTELTSNKNNNSIISKDTWNLLTITNNNKQIKMYKHSVNVSQNTNTLIFDTSLFTSSVTILSTDVCAWFFGDMSPQYIHLYQMYGFDRELTSLEVDTLFKQTS